MSESSLPIDEHDESAQLDWLAVQYVLGELSPDDAVSFETCLAEDQAARDSLVRATRLVENVSLAKPSASVPVSRRPALRHIAAALAAVAATLLVGLAVWNGSVPPEDARQDLAADNIDPARLVVLWAASEDTLNGSALGDTPDEAAAADPDSALLPPDWMLAAVEYEEGLLPEASDFDAENDAVERN
jgi:ferric-dicitrate binding protein FerR (iron transport regulator)